jgi:hypothetical protein
MLGWVRQARRLGKGWVFRLARFLVGLAVALVHQLIWPSPSALEAGHLKFTWSYWVRLL